MNKKYLIISTGRTGTLFFADLINALRPQVMAVHESRYSRLFCILSHFTLARLFPRSLLRFLWRKLNQHQHAEIIYDANNMLYALPYLIPEAFAEYKILHIFRTPDDYAESHLRFSKQRLRSFIANYLIPLWQPNGYFHGKILLWQWYRMSKRERFLWVWLFKNRLMRSYQRRFNYLSVSFDALFRTNVNDWRVSVLKFLDVPLEQKTDIEELFKQQRNQTQTVSLNDNIQLKDLAELIAEQKCAQR
ncbi:MAG: hypothetical protein HWE13_00140 [Gammaproteobacteria bacterium]|nr:hypothetical protein [Gammaproteobacteria bacterium]